MLAKFLGKIGIVKQIRGYAIVLQIKWEIIFSFWWIFLYLVGGKREQKFRVLLLAI